MNLQTLACIELPRSQGILLLALLSRQQLSEQACIAGVAQCLERLPRKRKVVGSIPNRVIHTFIRHYKNGTRCVLA